MDSYKTGHIASIELILSGTSVKNHNRRTDLERSVINFLGALTCFTGSGFTLVLIFCSGSKHLVRLKVI